MTRPPTDPRLAAVLARCSRIRGELDVLEVEAAALPADARARMADTIHALRAAVDMLESGAEAEVAAARGDAGGDQ